MISALKKFARKNGEAKSRPAMPAGVSYMGQSLQRKFGRGVQYNMKIVIKGDRNTGKSTLLARFQGKAFKEEYIPTNEIQVCSINWNYRVADDVVKVEVWDVVDKGKRKKSDGDGLKLANDMSGNDDQVGVLDAEFIDVYKGTHGCIMLMDITKQWTFKYVERELPKIPKHIPVLILSNFLDMQDHRVVQSDEITEYVKYFDRGENGAIIQYGECCMKNGFGLKFIHKFFNIPFLKLQRETLEKQLETNKEDMEATLEELSFHRNTEEQDYDKFITYMEKKSNEKNPPTPPKALGNNLKSSTPPPKSSTTSMQSRSTNKPAGSSKKSTDQAKGIDDFVPEDTIDSGFLEETDKAVGKNGKSKKKTTASSENESSDESDNEGSGNPMVSGFQDISSDEEDNIPESQPQKSNTSFDVDIEITSDESEAEEVMTLFSPVVENNDMNESSDTEKTTETTKPVVRGTKQDIVLNDEDNNFMDAWLDSPSTDPREVRVKSEKKDKNINKVGGNTPDLDIFAASQLTPKNSLNTPGSVEENSSSDVEEEKKKRHSEKKKKESEEGKPKHRSKHKHKKKSRTKDSDGEAGDLNEKKHKSKRKQRHKEGKSREKVEGTGAEYESF